MDIGPYYVSLFVVNVLHDEDHVKPREDCGHEVDVFLCLCVVPPPEDTVGRRQHGTARVEGGRDASLSRRETTDVSHSRKFSSSWMNTI